MCNDNETYLIVGLQGLVLLDVVGIIEEAFPGFRAVTAGSDAEAVALAAMLKSIRFAFLNVDPDAFVRTELAGILTRLGTRIVMMGQVAEEKAAHFPFDVLDRPFFEHDILRILKK